jgi:hypothetical protein
MCLAAALLHNSHNRRSSCHQCQLLVSLAATGAAPCVNTTAAAAAAAAAAALTVTVADVHAAHFAAAVAVCLPATAACCLTSLPASSYRIRVGVLPKILQRTTTTVTKLSQQS